MKTDRGRGRGDYRLFQRTAHPVDGLVKNERKTGEGKKIVCIFYLFTQWIRLSDTRENLVPSLVTYRLACFAGLRNKFGYRIHRKNSVPAMVTYRLACSTCLRNRFGYRYTGKIRFRLRRHIDLHVLLVYAIDSVIRYTGKIRFRVWRRIGLHLLPVYAINWIMKL